MIQLAEMAWHQGTDLYSWNNSRLFTCMVSRPYYDDVYCSLQVHSNFRKCFIHTGFCPSLLQPDENLPQSPSKALGCNRMLPLLLQWLLLLTMLLLLRLQEFHAFITLGGQPPECCYPLLGIGFLPCGWGEQQQRGLLRNSAG